MRRGSVRVCVCGCRECLCVEVCQQQSVIRGLTDLQLSGPAYVWTYLCVCVCVCVYSIQVDERSFACVVHHFQKYCVVLLPYQYWSYR